MDDILKGFNIFVLEDDPTISNFLNEFLSKYFNKVVAKTDNHFQYSDFDKIDIFILDIEISFDSGYEVCKRVKTIYPEKTVIFRTEHSKLENKIKSIELVVDLISKQLD